MTETTETMENLAPEWQIVWDVLCERGLDPTTIADQIAQYQFGGLSAKDALAAAASKTRAARAGTRGDTHSPANYDPREYGYLGVIYQGPAYQALTDYVHELDNPVARAAMHNRPFEGNHKRKNTCDHCGAAFHYGCVYDHLPSGQVIVIGHICADEAFGDDARRDAEMGTLRKKVKEGRQLAKARESWLEYTRENPDIQEIIEAHPDHNVIQDIASKGRRYGSLTENQESYMRQLVQWAREKAERQAQQAEEDATLVDVVEGRREITGRVLTTKVKETRFGFSTKMLVRTDDNQKLWGTVPAAILDDVQRGSRVRFTGTVGRSDRDSKFGFFSRPSKATLLTEGE